MHFTHSLRPTKSRFSVPGCQTASSPLDKAEQRCACAQHCPARSAQGAASDLARSKSALMLEDALLHQQLIVPNRQVKRPAPTGATAR